MTEEQATLLVLKGSIADLNDDERRLVDEAAQELRAKVQEYGECGVIAFALVGAEMAAA